MHFTFERLDQHGSYRPAEERTGKASRILCEMKLNDEPSDYKSVLAVKALDCVEPPWEAIATAGAALALFNGVNGRAMAEDLARRRERRVKESGKLLGKEEVIKEMQTCQTLVRDGQRTVPQS